MRRIDLTCLKCGWIKCDLNVMKCCSDNQQQEGGSRNFGHVLWLSIVAWTFSVVSVGACTFVRSGLEGAPYSELNDWGLFSYNLASDERQCVSYSSTVNYSAAVKTARAFGVICCLLTGFAMVQAICLQLVLQYKRELVWTTTRILAVAAPIAQLLTFTAFGDDVCLQPNVRCVLGPAGIVAMINWFVLLALALVCFIATPPSQPMYEIKRLEGSLTTETPEEKPTTIEEVESDGQVVDEEQEQAIYSYLPRIEETDSEDMEAPPEQPPMASKSKRSSEGPPSEAAAASPSKRTNDTSPDNLDALVKSVRPVSPDSEKRR